MLPHSMMLFAVSFQITELKYRTDYNNFLKEHEYSFIKFYLPTCSHCRHLAPRFIDLEDLHPKAALGALACEDALWQICREQEINGVPTLRLYKGDQFLCEYTSEWRDPKPMKKWIDKVIAEGCPEPDVPKDEN